MIIVVKRNKKKQPFSASKIKKSIQKAANEAEYSPSAAKKLANKIGNIVVKRFKSKEIIKSSQIKKAVLSKLDRLAKPVATSWRKYSRRH